MTDRIDTAKGGDQTAGNRPESHQAQAEGVVTGQTVICPECGGWAMFEGEARYA